METFRFDEIDTTNYFRLPSPGGPVPNIFNFNQPPPSSAVLAPSSRSQKQQHKQTSRSRQIHRNRVSYSCHACRRRKVKCDRQHPMCGNCTKNVESCVYDDPSTHKGKDGRSQKSIVGVKRRRTNEEVSTTNDDGEGGYSREYIVTGNDSIAATTSPPKPLGVNRLETKMNKLVEIVGRLYKDASVHGVAARQDSQTTDQSKTSATKGPAESGFAQSQPYLDVLQKSTGPLRSVSTESDHSASASSSPTHPQSPTSPPESSIDSRIQTIQEYVPLDGGRNTFAMKILESKIELAKQSGKDDDVDDLGIGHLSLQDGGRSRYVGTGFWGLLSNEVNELNQVLKAHTQLSGVGGRAQCKQLTEQAHAPPGASGSSSNSRPAAPQLWPDSKSYLSALAVFTKASFLQFEPREFEGRIFEIVIVVLEALPNKMYLDHLYKSFLHGVHPVMPLLHAPTFDEDYNRFWQWYLDSQHESPDSKLVENPTFVPLLMAVLYAGAISISSKTIKRLNVEKWTKESLSSCLYGATMNTLAACAFPRSPTVYSLISFLIVQTCQVREEEPLTSCSFVGMALRVAQSMGLHRDGSLFGLSEVECEVRRRVWWHIVYLDIQGAIATGLPPIGGSNADLYDTKMVSELGDEYIGLPQGAADPITPMTPHNARCQGFCKDKIDNRSSPSMILAAGRYESAVLLRSMITRQFSIRTGKRSQMLEMGKLIYELKLDLRKKISKIPVPGDIGTVFTPPGDLVEEESGIGVESSEVEKAFIFNSWARTMLSLFADRAYGVLFQPFLRSAKSNMWRHGRSVAIYYCHSFLRKFLYLSRGQLFQPYQWFCPGTYQPLQAVMILLLDLHERPFGEDAQKSRNFVDGVFGIFGEYGDYSTADGEGNRPLLEGGREAWGMLWRLRKKAYEKADIRIPTEQWEGGGGRKEPVKAEPEERFPPNPVQYAMQQNTAVSEPPPAPLAPPPFPDTVMRPPTPTPTPVASNDPIGDSLEDLVEMARIIDEQEAAFIKSDAVQEFMQGRQVFGSKMGFGVPEKVGGGAAETAEVQDNQFDLMAGGQEMMDFDWDEWDQVFGRYISVDMGDL